MISDPTIELISDNAVLVNFPAVIDEKINRRILHISMKLSDQISSEKVQGILDIIPTYHTLQVLFDALVIDPDKLIAVLGEIVHTEASDADVEKEVVEIPVCYEPPFALDTDEVCAFHDITPEELITKHTAVDYLIYMMGFTPGFPYLGGMDESIAIPRRDEPRLKIEAGSVGIAGPQTGIYPVDSPGGWQIIGRTPVKIFDSASERPFLLKAGQYIRFKPISKEQFDRLQEGTWEN